MMILSDMINQPSGCNVVFNKMIAMEKRHSSTGAFRFPESWGSRPRSDPLMGFSTKPSSDKGVPSGND